MKGSCLCRTISYECDELISGIVNCHCNTCRKAHAAPYVPTLGLSESTLDGLKDLSH